VLLYLIRNKIDLERKTPETVDDDNFISYFEISCKSEDSFPDFLVDYLNEQENSSKNDCITNILEQFTKSKW
jgi:hypothetical protein